MKYDFILSNCAVADINTFENELASLKTVSECEKDFYTGRVNEARKNANKTLSRDFANACRRNNVDILTSGYVLSLSAKGELVFRTVTIDDIVTSKDSKKELLKQAGDVKKAFTDKIYSEQFQWSDFTPDSMNTLAEKLDKLVHVFAPTCPSVKKNSIVRDIMSALNRVYKNGLGYIDLTEKQFLQIVVELAHSSLNNVARELKSTKDLRDDFENRAYASYEKIGLACEHIDTLPGVPTEVVA